MPRPCTPKRPSLARLLTSLRPPRGGTLPVRTGFPTSLADLVVKNHGRLRRERKPRRHDALVPLPSTPALTEEVADELSPPPSPPVRLISPVEVRRQDAPRPEKGAAVFRLRPELLAVGGAVALAVLAVWSEGTVVAFTVAALSLLWIESASRRRRRRRPTETNQTMALLLDSCGRGPVSPIREADDEAPLSCCSDSDRGSEAPFPRTAESAEVVVGAEDPTTPKRMAKRSLKKLLSKKLQKKPKSKDSPWSLDGDAEQPDAAVLKTESLFTASESSIEWSSSSESESAVDERGTGVKFPLGAWALAPVILAGLAVGKLPATALAVLCIVFSSAVQRL